MHHFLVFLVAFMSLYAQSGQNKSLRNYTIRQVKLSATTRKPNPHRALSKKVKKPSIAKLLTSQYNISIENPRQEKALICLFGVSNRSLKDTWPQIEKKVIKPTSYLFGITDIYIYDLITDNTNELNGNTITQNSLHLSSEYSKNIHIDYDNQSDVDILIESVCKNNYFKDYGQNPICQYRRDYSTKQAQNAVRQTYSEQKVSDYILLHENEYNTVVSLNMDLYPLLSINLHDMSTINSPDELFTSIQNDGDGITNGFYFGSPKAVGKAMARFRHIEENHIPGSDFEHDVLISLQTNKLTRKISNMSFCKLRNNGTCFYARGKSSPAYQRLTTAEKDEVDNELASIAYYS